MKQQITHLSPHQNGKVFGVLMAMGSLIFILPMFAISTMVFPHVNGVTPPTVVFLLFPILYLIMGYLSVAIGCLLYNFMFRYIGGIEFEAENKEVQ